MFSSEAERKRCNFGTPYVQKAEAELTAQKSDDSDVQKAEAKSTTHNSDDSNVQKLKIN